MPLSSQQQRRAQRRRVWIGGALGIVGVVVVGHAACPGAPARSRAWKNADYPPTAAEILAATSSLKSTDRHRRGPDENVLRIHLAADPVTFDPLRAPTRATLRVVMGTVFESLLGYVPAGSNCAGQYSPALATGWSVGADGRTLTFELRQGARFHDGTPVTAADAVLSIDRARGSGGPPNLRRLLRSIDRVARGGPQKLKIWLRREDATVLRALAEVPIVPAHEHEGVIGTGPYRLAAWDGRIARLEAAPSYWGEAPRMPVVEFVYEPDAARALIMARQGALDIISALSPAHYPAQQNAPRIAARLAPLSLAPATVRVLLPNTAAAPLSDARVRQAVALLVPREKIAEAFGPANWRPMSTLAWPGGPLCGDGDEGPGYDPARAANLLDAAGFTDDDDDGRRFRGPTRLRITFVAAGHGRGSSAGKKPSAGIELIVNSLKRAGFRVDVLVGTPAVIANRLEDGRFDLAMLEWQALGNQGLGAAFSRGGPLSHGRFSGPEIMALVSTMARTWDLAERARVAEKLALQISADAAVIPVAAASPHGLVSRRLDGVSVFDGWIDIPALFAAPREPVNK